jgi:alanyl-tRNA synthetase
LIQEVKNVTLQTMNSSEIRKRFISFFEKRGHAVLPSASLVPENDPSVLFNTAGMQPLVPYLLGEKHPLGTRLVNFQKCVRTGDIDDIGDNTHATFFEMMGNWSLGDYFKEDAIRWSYELLTSKEEGFGLDPNRLYVTVFEGDENAPRDEEAAEIWKKLIPENRIYYRPADKNWWSPGDNGPCGPDTEMFYDLTKDGLGDMTLEEYLKADDEQKVVEIWNDVFMEYVKKDGKVVGKLDRKNVDTGSGFERITMVLQNKDNIFDTDLFLPIIQKIEEFTTIESTEIIKAKRIIADHLRAAVFLIGDGVLPGNKDQGYILRRLLRRAVRYADTLNMKHGSLFWIADTVVTEYKDAYPLLITQKEHIKTEIDKEESKFRSTLEKGIKEFERMATKDISGEEAFLLLSSYGFPLDLIKELAKEKGIKVDEKGFDEEFKKHQDLSRSGSEQKFKGGLSGTGEMETRYHTATHLLNAALREILGTHISQKGSNITSERMRFDFSHPQKMTDEEKKKVEDLVNQKIKEAHPVTFKEMPKEEAEKIGAIHAFGDKYGDIVKVYSIGNEKDGYFSQEFCGGPHVSNTSEIGNFKIAKEEAVSQGVRRIKAVLE